jgi:hypothetical protein
MSFRVNEKSVTPPRFTEEVVIDCFKVKFWVKKENKGCYKYIGKDFELHPRG